MKNTFKFAAFAVLASFAAPAANAAVYTYTGDWNNTIASSFGDVSGTLNYENTSSATGTVSVPTLDLGILQPGETLVSVTITYTAPLVGQSDTISSSLTVPVASSQLFTSVTTEAATKLWSVELASILNPGYSGQANLFTSGGAYFATDTDNSSSVTVTTAAPLSGSLVRNYTQLRYTSGSATEALLLTSSGGSNPTMTFDVRTDQYGAFVRASSTSDVNFSFAGTDSGRITLTYTTAIPEPGAALLGSLGLLALLRRRR